MPAPPSRCDSDNAPQLRPHYAPAAPSRYTSYTSSSPMLTMLMLAWCPCNMPLTLPPICALITPYASTPPMLTIHMLLRRPQDIPPTLPSTLLMPSPTCLIFFADYHPYALAVSSRHASNASPHLCPHHSLRFHTPAAHNP
ncbi:hypothetical protein O181_099187 [Austropuccinia psidii MF-1]|uniref:Uncharacterized protein n=1 Tax=Austropuccinia psidii MF-1 TaxID=1389203 RepID=A0A9Q3JCS0_9BASI|nr:hypothetical protein [Austropuccinia psidii MF-1]